MENKAQLIQVPAEFILQPFYANQCVIEFLPQSSIIDNIRKAPFIYDIVYKVDQEQLVHGPWNDTVHSIEALFTLWRNDREEIATYFKLRQKSKAAEAMSFLTSVFLDALFWLNERPIKNLTQWEEEVSGLSAQPVNALERLQFIINGPGHYHSFIQLNELYQELEKVYAKKMVLKNRQ